MKEGRKKRRIQRKEKELELDQFWHFGFQGFFIFFIFALRHDRKVAEKCSMNWLDDRYLFEKGLDQENMNILHTDWLIGKKAPTFSQLPRRFFIHIYLLNLKTTMLCLQNSTWAIEINFFKWFTLGLAKKTILGLSCPKNTVTRIKVSNGVIWTKTFVVYLINALR